MERGNRTTDLTEKQTRRTSARKEKAPCSQGFLDAEMPHSRALKIHDTRQVARHQNSALTCRSRRAAGPRRGHGKPRPALGTCGGPPDRSGCGQDGTSEPLCSSCEANVADNTMTSRPFLPTLCPTGAPCLPPPQSIHYDDGDGDDDERCITMSIIHIIMISITTITTTTATTIRDIRGVNERGRHRNDTICETHAFLISCCVASEGTLSRS